jgi:hypothetical protein
MVSASLSFDAGAHCGGIPGVSYTAYVYFSTSSMVVSPS